MKPDFFQGQVRSPKKMNPDKLQRWRRKKKRGESNTAPAPES